MASSVGTGRILSATRRSWRVSTALTTVASPPRPTVARTRYRPLCPMRSGGTEGPDLRDRDRRRIERGVGQAGPAALPLGDLELAVQVGEVLLDRSLAHVQRAGDLPDRRRLREDVAV